MRLWLLFPAPHVYPTDSARQLPGRDARVKTQTTTQCPRCHSGREARSGNCPVCPYPQAWAATLGAVLTLKFLLLMVQFHPFADGVGRMKSHPKRSMSVNGMFSPTRQLASLTAPRPNWIHWEDLRLGRPVGR